MIKKNICNNIQPNCFGGQRTNPDGASSMNIASAFSFPIDNNNSNNNIGNILIFGKDIVSKTDFDI